MSGYLLAGLIVILLGSSNQVFAQDSYYYHTIHSHGLTTNFGRTVKLNYLYQLVHSRQLKLSGTYVYDNYGLGRNEVSANIYNIHVQMQWNVFHNENFFCNLAAGGGGYYLQAKDLLAIKFHEWRPGLVGGMELEYFVKRNTIALTLNYDFFYMPWSKIYDYLHVPTAGVTFFFF
jgi:hypothetical protein